MNQYQDLYDENTQCIPQAEARHIKRPESTNPFITALPPQRNQEEIILSNSCSPELPPIDIFKKLSPEERIARLSLLSNCRICLPYYNQIEENIDRALIEAYERKASIMKDHPYTEYTYQDKETETFQHSHIKKMGNAPTGFAILGESGCGKTNGVCNALEKYPKVIIHNPGTMQQYIQIPIIYVQMPENSNFHGLYESIGKNIDEILGNSNVYRKELSRKESLSKKFHKLCNLIEVFNIGLLVIDEIELISKSRVSDGTLETFMSLANVTGIAIGVVGTEDAFSKLFYEPRVTRRMGELINADNYCSNEKNINMILNTLHAYLPGGTPLTKECKETYYKESNGIIAYIMRLFVNIAIELTKLEIKGKKAEITPKLIQNVAAKRLANKKAGDKNHKKNRISNDEELSNNILRKLLYTNTINNNKNEKEKTKNEEPETTEQPKMKLMDIVKIAIHAFRKNEFTDKEIETAFLYITQKSPKKSLSETITATHTELQHRKEEKERKLQKKEIEKEALEDMDSLLKSLPIAKMKGIKDTQEVPYD